MSPHDTGSSRDATEAVNAWHNRQPDPAPAAGQGETRHYVSVFTFHGDGSASQRLWRVTQQRAEQVVAPLGKPTYAAHTPAAAHTRAQPAAAELAAASIILTGGDLP